MTSPLLLRIIERTAGQIAALHGWTRSAVAFAGGALSALSLAPYHLFPVLLVTLPVLVWLLDGIAQELKPGDGKGRLRGALLFFRIGWLFGFGYFLAGLWWVGKAFLVDADEFALLLPVAVLILPAGMSLYWGLAAALAWFAWREGWMRLAALASSLTLAEWMRGMFFSGFPWNVPGYAAMPTPVLMQSSSVIGLYGVTFLLLVVAMSPAIFWPAATRVRYAMTYLGLCMAIALMHWSFGQVVLTRNPTRFVEGINLRIVQPAIEQSEKWDEANEASIMARYLTLSTGMSVPGARPLEDFTFLIWPESAFPFMLADRPEQLAVLASLLPEHTFLITGAMRPQEAETPGGERNVFNSLYVIDSQGELVASRDKNWLVPFGEFLPFQELLESLGLEQLTRLRGGFSAGSTREIVKLPDMPAFLPLICYEIIFSGSLRPQDRSKGQAGWIVNLTNDAWFGMTAGPYQHAHQSQIRAVEEGLPVIRAANSGISFVSDANGRIVAELALGQRGTLESRLPAAAEPTIFSRFGNFPTVFFVCLILLSLIGLSALERKKL